MISELPFGAFLVYSPKGSSKLSSDSRQLRDLIKFDRSAGTPPVNAIAYSVDRLRSDPAAEALRQMLTPDAVLVPCPGSNPLPPVAGPVQWTPRRISQVLVTAGLGRSVLECLRRSIPVPKSAFATPGGRPSPKVHYESIIATELPLTDARRIVVVDDFVTKGATLLGAASRLAELFPEASIVGFALVRTKGLVPEIDRIVEPVVGTIRLLANGEAHREP